MKKLILICKTIIFVTHVVELINRDFDKNLNMHCHGNHKQSVRTKIRTRCIYQSTLLKHSRIKHFQIYLLQNQLD